MHDPHRRAGRALALLRVHAVQLRGRQRYPVYANWVWGGGFLSTLGKHFGLGHGQVDFAGSSVVHLTGGTIAAVAAKMLGPRYGKYGDDGSVNPIVAHSMPLVVCGTFVLAFDNGVEGGVRGLLFGDEGGQLSRRASRRRSR